MKLLSNFQSGKSSQEQLIVERFLVGQHFNIEVVHAVISLVRELVIEVVVDDATSGKFNMDFGVPQGSCLGLLLFSIYTTPLFDIVSNHLPTVHCYADDTQLYLVFQPDDTAA